jgi:hypothetical protein
VPLFDGASHEFTAGRHVTASRRARDQKPIRPFWLAWAIVAAVVLAAAVALYLVTRPDFLVSRASLEKASAQMLRDHGPFGGPSGCAETTVGCMGPGCHKARGSAPFTYRSVCYLAETGHFTVIFSRGRGDKDYSLERGVFYRPDETSPEPGGVCIRHVFGRWWEFVPEHDPNCSRGFDDFTGWP